MAAAEEVAAAARAPTPYANPEGEGNLLRKRRARGRGRSLGGAWGAWQSARPRGRANLRTRQLSAPARAKCRGGARQAASDWLSYPFRPPRRPRPRRFSGVRPFRSRAPGGAAGFLSVSPERFCTRSPRPLPRPWTLTLEPRSCAVGQAASPSWVGREVALRLRQASSLLRPWGKGWRAQFSSVRIGAAPEAHGAPGSHCLRQQLSCGISQSAAC